jgi:hypothetical protein
MNDRGIRSGSADPKLLVGHVNPLFTARNVQYC